MLLCYLLLIDAILITRPFQTRMSSKILIFAYGSNMLTQRLRNRVPSAVPQGTGFIRGYTLEWHKAGTDNSGKCDILPSDSEEDVVWGVLYHVSALEKPDLDRIEDLGVGYGEKEFEVHTEEGSVRAFAYHALQIDASLDPYAWYKAYVVQGAIEHALPEHYVEKLQARDCKADPDKERAELNWSVIRSRASG